MTRLRELLSRLSGARRKLAETGSDDAELRAELEAHLDMAIAEYMRRGMGAEEARRAALIESGGITAAVESVREQRGISSIEKLVSDVRLAVRTLSNQRGFSTAVLLTLGMGIAATVTMFSILNAVIIRPLPFPEPDRIVSLSLSDRNGDRETADDRSYENWLQSSKVAQDIAVHAGYSAVLQTPNRGPQEIRGTLGTEPYFRVLGVSPMLGRVFNAEESRRGGPSVVVIGESLWREEFASDPNIIGKAITLEEKPVTVVGVMPASAESGTRSRFWRPYRLAPSDGQSTFYYFVIARLRDNATVAELHSELTAIQRRTDAQRAESTRGLEPVVMTLHQRRYGDVRQTLVLLFSAVGILLVITCANIANLSLARALKREREFAVRIALGASRWRVIRYVLTESFLLSIGGAIVGLAIAASSIGYFVRISPDSVANAQGVGIDKTVLAFTLVLTAVTTALFGLVPAIAASRSNANLALSGATARTAGSRAQRFMRRSLVVMELATALVLVVGAGLVARTFWKVTSLPMGFESHALTATIKFPWNKYTDTTARIAAEELLERVRREPSVKFAAFSDALPLTGARMSQSHSRPDGTDGPRFEVVGVTSQHFETLGTRIVEGRAIGPFDRANGIDVLVVTDALARAMFPGKSAIGQQFVVDGRPRTIVGVSEDVRQRGLEGSSSLVAFIPLAQYSGWNYLQLAIRGDGERQQIASAVSRIYQDIEPHQPAPTFRTMDEIIDETVAPRRFVFILLGIFAGLAAILAVIGLYGVLSYLVSEQTREIGIRIALGANRRDVLRLVLGQGVTLAGIGVGAGLAVAFMIAGFMEKLVYDLSVRDLQTFTTAAVLLTSVSLLASFLPARRASRVDPMVALRVE